MAITALELIRRGAAQHGPRTAVVFGSQSMTFTEVDALSARLGNALRAAGAQPGERVALLANNSLYSLPLDFACVKAGLNRVPLNARLALPEHLRMLQGSGCRLLIFGADLAERAAALRDALPGLVCFGLDASLPGGSDLIADARQQSAQDPDVTISEDDVVLTLFTSGTTGTLKAAQHTHRSYAAICHNILLNLLPATPDDAMLHAASLIHASGMFVLAFWMRGAKAVILPGFEPAAYLATLERERVTAINLVPTMLQMLVELPAMATCNVEALRYVIYGASPMPRVVIERAMAIWGQHRFWQYFGQTEAPLCLTVLRPEDHHGERLGACGQVGLEVEVRLLDEAGDDVRPGEPGEIAIRAPFSVCGYHDAPELNAQTFLADGWVRTRDVGVFDEHGFLYLKDRTSDMIVSGGYNVYPREVEEVLLTHPAVRECAVIGLHDDKWVEAVTGVVALEPGHTGNAQLEAALISYVSAQLASYKKPQRIRFDPDIPKTAVGKLNRRALRERYK
jgi:fatty-acyl-CoA synthase